MKEKVPMHFFRAFREAYAVLQARYMPSVEQEKPVPYPSHVRTRGRGHIPRNLRHKRKYPGWFSLSMIIPKVGGILYLVALWFVAFKDRKKPMKI